MILIIKARKDKRKKRELKNQLKTTLTGVTNITLLSFIREPTMLCRHAKIIWFLFIRLRYKKKKKRKFGRWWRVNNERGR